MRSAGWLSYKFDVIVSVPNRAENAGLFLHIATRKWNVLPTDEVDPRK
jgi:hypothetical protein